MSMKNSNGTIGSRTRDLPACSAEPQPTALRRAPRTRTHLQHVALVIVISFPWLVHLSFDVPNHADCPHTHKRTLAWVACRGNTSTLQVIENWSFPWLVWHLPTKWPIYGQIHHSHGVVSTHKRQMCVNLLKPTGHVMHQQFNIQQLYVLPTQCIYVFCIYLRTNSDLCHLHHKLIGFYNRDEKCLLRGTEWVFK